MNPRATPCEKFLKFYEHIWNVPKSLPHHHYVGRPFYKLLGGNKFPQISVPATFFLMDYLFHELIVRLIRDWCADELSLNTFSLHRPLRSIIWTSLSLPVVYYKMQKNKQNQSSISGTPQTLFSEVKQENVERQVRPSNS